MRQLIKTGLGVAMLALCLPAMAEIVVVMNPKAAETALSKEEVSQYFLGKSGALVLIDQPEGAICTEFYRKVTGKDTPQVKSLWSRPVFTGKATMPREAADGAAVKQMVASDPKAIGYIDKSAVDSSVKAAYSAR